MARKDDRVIPNAVVLPTENPTATNATVKQSQKMQITACSRDSVIPVVYGGPERMAGMLYTARVHQGKFVICLLLCEGPVESITGLQMNDLTIPLRSSYTVYLGTQTQGVDPTLAACIPGYTETHPGTAYIVAKVAPNDSQGFPRITALVKGLKVYDPRDDYQILEDPASWKWSDNPALCAADFLTSPVYGARKTVDWDSVATAADYCDELITGDGGTEKRNLITLALAESRDVEEWITVLRGYVPGWIDYIGDVAYLIADAPHPAIDNVFGPQEISTDTMPEVTKRGVRNRPNVVEIGFMRTDVTPWAMDYVSADLSPIVRRKSRVDMPGIRRYSQAKRFAIEKLNHSNLEAVEATLSVFAEGLKVMIGDVDEVTDDIGFSATPMRVMARKDLGFGAWALGLRKYDSNAYDDTVQVSPATPDTGLPDATNVQPPTNLVLVEKIYLAKDVAPDGVSRGFVYQSRIEASWGASPHEYPVTYSVYVVDGTQIINESMTQDLAYASGAVQQGRSYQVDVVAENSVGFRSTTLSGTILIQGKVDPPSDVPAITFHFELGGVVFLEWQQVLDSDIDRYEWKYADPSGFDYDAATLIDRVDGFRTQFKGIQVGLWRFAVKAMDSAGRRSVNALTVDITVTTDLDAFVQSHAFVAPTLVNMVAYPMVEGLWKPRWATSVAGLTFDAAIPGTVNSVATPIIVQHASGTSSFTGEAWDLGAPVTGDWIMVAPTTVVSGFVDYYIETSDDLFVWTRRAGLSWKGTARAARPVVEALTSSTVVLEAPPSLSISANSRTESGQVTTLASGGLLVQLGDNYVAAQDLQVTPCNTTASRNAVWDRLLLHAEDGLCQFFTVVPAAGDELIGTAISVDARTMLAGDFLEFDVYLDSSNPLAAADGSQGGFYIGFTDASNTATDLDTDGYHLIQPDQAFDALARGQWRARKTDMSAHVGKIASIWANICGSDVGGDYKVLYRNIRITDGAGTLRQQIWASGEPTYNVDIVNVNVVNNRVGPSNSFLVYVFVSNTAVQVASDARWNFKGI